MTAGTVSVDELIGWLGRFRELIVEHRIELTELDSAIGDADHGANMARGLEAVMAKVRGGTFAGPGELFKVVGMTLVTSVGGASGPLYGTFFLRMGMAGGDGPLDAAGLSALLAAGLEGVVARGKAEAGDKTMFDAMAPAVAAFTEHIGRGPSEAARAASEAADRGRAATEPMLARKGRASYLGERSVGHIDPGAASTALLFRSLAEELART